MDRPVRWAVACLLALVPMACEDVEPAPMANAPDFSAFVLLDFAQLSTAPDGDSAACVGSSTGWEGCRGNGCAVCSERLVDYPKYLSNHPLCTRNDACAGSFYSCNSSSCPEPSAIDQ
jgi:hypothetical protein